LTSKSNEDVSAGLRGEHGSGYDQAQRSLSIVPVVCVARYLEPAAVGLAGRERDGRRATIFHGS
jgi:hypothetical protein